MQPLGLLAGGCLILYKRARRFGAGPFFLAAAAMTTPTLPTGIWGGEQVRLEVSDRAAVLKLGCAEATLPGPITLDAQGHFVVQGRYTRFEGGPSVAGDAATGTETRFEGTVQGDRLLLTVRRPDGTERHNLVRGLQSKVIGCY